METKESVAEMKVEGSPAEGGRREEVKRGVLILDLVLRVIAAIGAVGSAVAMATTTQTLSFFSQTTTTTTTQFIARFNDLPALTFFVISNSIVGAYLLLSLPVSVFNLIKNSAKTARIILIIFDEVALGLVTAGAAAATTVAYLAHRGNSSVNWAPFCQQFDSFCQRISVSLIGSFGAAICFFLLISISSSPAVSHRS